MDLSHLNSVNTTRRLDAWVSRLVILAQKGPDVSELNLRLLEYLINLARLRLENSCVDLLLRTDKVLELAKIASDNPSK